MVETTPLIELDELREAVYVGGKKVFSWDYLKELTPFALAVWYMDDGSFAVRRKDGSAGRSDICVQAMDKGSQRRLQATLRETYGLSCKLVDRVGQAFIIFDRDGTEALHELIAPYVPAVMEYKLLQHHRGKENVTVEPANKTMKLTAVPIVSIDVKPTTRSMRRFDLEIEGHHNYLVDGVMVHNSPETTPGGRALKFYSSVRLDIRRIETLKEGTGEGIGNRVRVKVAKNKMAPPFRKAEFDIMFGEGISREGSLLDIAVDEGVVRKSGAWFTFDDDQLGQGRENAKRFLKENPEIAMQLQDKVYQAVGLVDSPEAAEGSEEAGTEPVAAEEATEE
jgi:recombination protein RecA